ncbi:Multidrug resistance protein MdtF [Chromobacterium violaceum]|uniref:Multidrug resistance protein MdtF n=1 Tax=Chromobacterium violaceum TaxID=536 RepID=A0A3S4HUS8_CHRVL|nr:Multidrug resistance protein MdtF [Chromobacterium violaceum]
MKKLNLSEWALGHQALVRYLMIMLMLAGAWAYTQLGQKEDPEFTFKAMLVQANWPGASTLEMERQVTDKLEEKLQEMGEIDYVQSYTKPGESLMVVSLREDVPPKNVPQLWYQVRKKLGDIAYTLPSGVQGPFFNDEFGDTFGNIYAFSGDGFGYEELRQYAEAAKKELLRVPDVAKVQMLGKQEQRIYVDLSAPSSPAWDSTAAPSGRRCSSRTR